MITDRPHQISTYEYSEPYRGIYTHMWKFRIERYMLGFQNEHFDLIEEIAERIAELCQNPVHIEKRHNWLEVCAHFTNRNDFLLTKLSF